VPSLLTVIFLLFISSPVYAHGAPPDSVLWAILFVYVLPFFIGIWLVGKGNRLWFSGLSLIVYIISFSLFYFTKGLDTEDLFYFFSPYILIIIAFIKRRRSKRKQVIQED